MPEYQLNLVASDDDKMSLAEARDYAPQWGSYMSAGDPGGCMYADPGKPANAKAMLSYIESSLIPYTDNPKGLERLADFLRTVGTESDWDRASPLEQGFIEALFFMAPDDESDDGDIHRDGGVDELAPQAWETVRKFCEAFRAAAGSDLTAALELGDYDESQAGRDLAFTACGAGVGFSDRDALEEGLHASHGSPRVGDSDWHAYAAARENCLAARLEKHARAAAPYCEGLYRGDDSRLYIYA